jgi:AcrR family transcriptional regulator
VKTVERSVRRRGDTLVAAIQEATMAELALQGYDGLTIEGVAERAKTGKASIYRRWPNKLELTLDAIDAHLPSIGASPDTGSVRGDLLFVLRRIAKHMNSRTGGAMRACMTDVKTHGELAAAVRERLVAPRKQVMFDVLKRGIERGEVRPDALSDRVVELGPMLLGAEQLQRGRALRDADVVAIVDDVLIPLIRPMSS